GGGARAGLRGRARSRRFGGVARGGEVTKARVVRLPDLPPGVVARAATRRDIDTIFTLVASCELANDGVSEGHPDDIAQAIDLANSGGGVIAVDDAGGMVAWAKFVHVGAEADVHPDHLGRGIGPALIAWTEEQARASGRTRVRQIVT